MHAADRRPVASWPAALLPGALLVATIVAGVASPAGNGTASPPAQAPVTELHVVSGDDD